MADKYGMPPGGDPYPGKVKYYKGNTKKLDAAYLQKAVYDGGWPEKLRNTAVAIAMAESNGATHIYNTYKKGHFGLFQISRSAWPDLFALGSDRWTDPKTNAAYAYKIYKQQGFKAWEAYSNGRYKNYLKGAEGGVVDNNPGSIAGDAIGDAIGNAVDDAGLGGITDVLTSTYESLTTPAFWMRIAYGFGGVVLLAGGLFLIVKSSPIGAAAKSATNAVANVTPVGRAATVAKSTVKKKG